MFANKLIDFLRKAGLPVHIIKAKDVENLTKDGNVLFMGSKTNKKRDAIKAFFDGKELSDIQRKIIDVFTGITNSNTVNIGGKKILIRQGNELNAGVRHILSQHFDSNKGTISAEDLLLIQDVVENGIFTQNTRKGKVYNEYNKTVNGVVYTVVTERSNNKELLINVLTDEQKEFLANIPVAKYTNGEEIIPKDDLVGRIKWQLANGWSDLYEVAEIATHGKKNASEKLNEAGFVGMHYIGRTDGECYVIFDDADLEIKDVVQFRSTENADVRFHAENNSENSDNLRKITDKEAENLLQKMKDNATIAEEIELNPENWKSLFGDNGIVNTPIGDVKMGENQYAKLSQKGRNGKLGMIKPTLEDPDIIVEDDKTYDGEKYERESSYVFVKTFKNSDGERIYYFASVTISIDGNEVVISNQEKSKNRIANLLNNGKLAYSKLSASETQNEKSVSLGDSQVVTNADNNSTSLGINSPTLFDDKDTTNNLNDQEKSQKNAVTDKKYADAYKNGDEKTARELLIQSYKAKYPDTKVVDESGNPLVMHHVTDEEFTVFDPTMSNYNGAMFFKSTEGDGGMGSRIMNVFLNITKPIEHNTEYYVGSADMSEHTSENDGVINRYARDFNENEEQPLFSSDGKFLGFTRKGEIYLVEEYLNAKTRATFSSRLACFLVLSTKSLR